MLSLRTVAALVGVAATYVIAARFGFRFAFVAEQITTVWAPTGLAMAALLLGGKRLWPAVWIGAFVANVGTSVPVWVAGGIATGNTLEALAAAWTLARVPRFDAGFRTIRSVVAFVIVGAVASPAISATIGVSTLCAAAIQPWSRFSELWSAWWLGDALGALVIAPAILTLALTAQRWTRRQLVETAALVAGTFLTTHFVFRQPIGPAISGHPFEFVIFPFVIGAAMRQQLAATTLVVLTASGLAIWHTVRGAGPFAEVDVHRSLILLQTFTGVLAGTGLLLGAAIAERRTAERRRAAAHAVGDVLSEAESLTHAAPAILNSLCQSLDWSFASLWIVDHGVDRLRCLATWFDTPTAEPFAQISKSMLFASGVGLPGRVWASGRATWVEDVARDANFPRAIVARAGGFHAAFAFPICLGDDLIGVIECFNRRVLPLDTDLLRTMSAVGDHVGQFVGRKRVESEVADEQRRTRAILDTAIDAIVGMDHQGRVTDFNPAAARMFGYSASDAVGADLAQLLIPPALRDQYHHGLSRYLATGSGPFVDRLIETTACHADGHQFPVEVAIALVPGEHPPRFTGFVRDLTARAATEREREQLLQRELDARRYAEAANRAKDEFLATLSHELRTPLNAIVGWTRLLLDGTLDEQNTKKALQVIDRNAQLQTQLVADILDVSRIITGGLRLNVRPVDLRAVIAAAVDAVRPAATAKNVRLTSRLSLSSPVHEGDPQRLQQVVWNLLTNAVKFTPAGGWVEIALFETADGSVCIRVQDNGAGIDPAISARVFERFWQADGTKSRQHGGLGLGLAIVRHLVELHGGSVRVESAGPGLGSTFVVQLPQARPDERFDVPGGQPTTADAASLVAPISLEGCRVLVVDDEQDAREMVATILTGAGASVETVSSVEEALEHLQQSATDVLLADLGMPGADGYDLIREVRRLDGQTGRHLPALALTAYAGAEDRARALDAGFDRYAAKPIRPQDVLEATHSMWQRARVS